MTNETKIEDAPLGLEEEFPDYVWALFDEANCFICHTLDGETFAISFRRRSDAEAYKHRPENMKKGSPGKKGFLGIGRTEAVPDKAIYRVEEWPRGEFETRVKEGGLRSTNGSYIRGLILLGSSMRVIAKRYLR